MLTPMQLFYRLDAGCEVLGDCPDRSFVIPVQAA